MEIFTSQMSPWKKENKVGRNDLCPCGAGRSIEDSDGIIVNIRNKFKNCCMKTGKYSNYKN